MIENSGQKSKMISVRLSPGEFDFLKTRYRSYGARNASDLARLAVQRVMHGWDNPGGVIAIEVASLVEQTAGLHRRVEVLESEVAQLFEDGGGDLKKPRRDIPPDSAEEEK